MRVSPVLVLLASCVPTGSSQQPPAPWAQQPPWAQQAPVAQTPTAQTQTPTAAGGTCPEVFACYTRCATIDEACITGCESGVDPYAANAARQLAICTGQNQCTDFDCQQTNCSSEVATCAGTGGAQQPQVATAPTSTTNVPAAPSGGSRGHVYAGISITAGGLDDFGGHSIEFRVLFDDGSIARFFPPTGLDGVDTASLRAIYSDMVGTYRVDGDLIEASYPTEYGAYEESFQMKRDGTLEGRHHVAGTFTPTEPLDGVTLDGTYVCGTATWGFQFTADGRFHADKDAMMVLRDRQGNLLNELPAGSGSYRIAANTLTLAYDSGQVVYIALATIVDTSQFPRPDRLFINTWPYHRV